MPGVATLAPIRGAGTPNPRAARRVPGPRPPLPASSDRQGAAADAAGTTWARRPPNAAGSNPATGSRSGSVRPLGAANVSALLPPPLPRPHSNRRKATEVGRAADAAETTSARCAVRPPALRRGAVEAYGGCFRSTCCRPAAARPRPNVSVSTSHRLPGIPHGFAPASGGVARVRRGTAPPAAVQSSLTSRSCRPRSLRQMQIDRR